MNARKITTGILTAVVMATLGLSQAHAVDGKLYPGSMCNRFAGATTVLPTLNASRLLNPSTTTVLRLDCPVIHDSIAPNLQSGYVDVIDQNFSGDVVNNENNQVCAELFSTSQVLSSFLTIRSTGRRCTTGASATSKRLFVGGLPANSNAHYFYGITLPPKFSGFESAVISYRVDENE
ncbi:MAG: hypothetical protein HOP18_11155 [Deltaproteobacteria bacterium]|nr:hypothetical protein [Deltaproteobacteria bacterium]